MKKITLFKMMLLTFLVVGSMNVSAQLLVENFDYTLGSLLTSDGWSAHSGAGTQAVDVTTGLSFTGYPGSGVGGAANLDNNGEDVNKTFATQTSGVIYASFLLSTGATNSAGYFFMFAQNPASTTFVGRIFVNSTGTGIGISNSSTAPSSYVTITPGMPALVVVKYDFTTQFSSLYVLDSYPTAEPGTPSQVSATSVPIANGVGSVALRQYNASQNQVIDGIRVGTTWSEVLPSPTISVTETTVPSMTSGVGLTDTKTVIVTGSDLTADVLLSITGTDAAQFSVSPSPITPSNGSINETVTITYHPNTTGTHTATLEVASAGATTVTRELTGNASPSTDVNAVNSSSDLGLCVYNGKIKFTTVAGERVQIYNSVGQQVVNTFSVEGRNEISVPNAKGMYVVKVGTKTAKVIL